MKVKHEALHSKSPGSSKCVCENNRKLEAERKEAERMDRIGVDKVNNGFQEANPVGPRNSRWSLGN